ncbi:hypothetical protein [Vibrio harveyi]|uniref:hypothetical protein n=1 Tax=Vibrio harveyi TaxID=669 RepID=UPI0025B13894|nr:hypothetical protein [Vibrio harveyi]WJT09262.1 hypothetical protein PH545_24865 [Vibrio harveyi]
MATFKVVKTLDAITNHPYAIFASEKPTKDGFIVKLTKMSKTKLKEGDRLSWRGLEALTKHVSLYHCAEPKDVNTAINMIVDQWNQANEKHTRAKQ